MSVKISSGGHSWEQPTQLFIDNEFVDATSGKTITAYDPSTEEPLASVQAANAADIDRAVKSSRKAFKTTWRNVSGSERAALLLKLADLLEEQAELFSVLEATNGGKPRFTNAIGDVEEGYTILRHYAGYADKIKGQLIMEDPKRHTYTRHQPFGVVGAVIPWNYPLATSIWKIAPALAAGNTLVLKTAENTPLSMLYFGNLVKAAGIPPGVLNIVSGFGAEAGAALASHMDVDKLTFTGSTMVGQKIMEQAAKSNVKDVLLELGGKSPMVVFKDSDIGQAAEWAFIGIMYNMGQVCCATSRLIVEDEVYDEFLAKFAAVVKKEAIIGDVHDEKTTHGPQISKAQFEKVLNYIKIGQDEGARVVCGGKRWGTRGYYIEPTILADVKPDDRVAQEEIFGPVASVIRFKGYDEGVAIANNSQYGLGGAVFTRDISKAHQAAAEIDTGTVWINSSNDQTIYVPFGGHKMSGVGSELGSYGLDSYLRPKTVQVNLSYKL